MINFYEVIDRAMTGKYCTNEEFELELFSTKVRELVKKYDIMYDPQNPIPSDDNLADRVFEAGIELYKEVGTYCPDSERIIKFTEKEMLEALDEAPDYSIIGEGKDARKLVARAPESEIPPFCFIGAGGSAISNEVLYASIMETYAGFMPLADSITAPSLASINGRAVVADSPLELLAAIKATALGKEAFARAGRPGLAIMNNIATAGSSAAKIAGSQFGLKPSDAWLIGYTSELKFSYERFNEIGYVLNLGGHILSETAPILGGYCGGPEGVAITLVAYHFSSILVSRCDSHHIFPVHFKYGCTSPRNILWATSLGAQAITRNSQYPLFIDHYSAGGPMTDMFFYENAADIMATVVSGGHINGTGSAKGTKVDYFTPIEPKFASEVGHATVGMSRKEANAIAKKLLDKYESRLDDPPLGKKYIELWDIEKKMPKDEYQRFYEKIRQEICEIGIPLKTY